MYLGVKWQRISFYDINAMYPCTFQEEFPTGIGIEWTLNEDLIFQKKLMTDKKISMGSIQWLDYIQNTSDLIVDKSGKRIKIASGWNSNEYKIGGFYLDGYAKVDGTNICFEFDGCHWHGCSLCKTEPDEDQKARNKRRNLFLRSKNFKIVRTTECEWIKLRTRLMKENSYVPKISSLLYKNNIHHFEMCELIEQNRIYGFCVVDIEATSKAKKFLDLNWPPILQKKNIEFTDLPEWMREHVDRKSFPRKTIVQTMNGSNLLLHTSLIKWYLENGFKVTYIHKIFEYEGAFCFKDVFTTGYEARVEATQTNDSLKATAVKLILNSMYGQLLLV